MIICIFARWLCSVVSMDCSRKYIQCAINTFTILTRLPFIWWENQFNMKVGMWKCVSTIKGTRTNHRVICTSSVYAYSIHTVYTYSTSSMTHETHFCHSNVFLSNIQKMLPKTGKIKKKKRKLCIWFAWLWPLQTGSITLISTSFTFHASWVMGICMTLQL